MAGRLVDQLATGAVRAAQSPRERAAVAEPYPVFGDTQPMCFEARRPEPAATQRITPRAPR